MNYYDIDAVNYSTLKVLHQQSPRHYLYRLENPRTPTAAMLLGSAVHCAILEPLRFQKEYTVRPDWVDGRTKDGKAWLADHAGQPILKQDDYDACVAMRAAVEGHPEAAPWLDDGQVEHVIQWTDVETGLACKGRLDLLHTSGALVGLKTATAASPWKFAIDAAKFCYHLQWAFYHDGLCVLELRPPVVVEIVVESAAPYDVVVYEIDDDTLYEGRIAYREALTTLVKCREMNRWPGICEGTAKFQLPRYALSEGPDGLEGLDMDGVRSES